MRSQVRDAPWTPTPASLFFAQFPDETLRSGELLNMIVAVIDSAQVRRARSSWGAGGAAPVCTSGLGARREVDPRRGR